MFKKPVFKLSDVVCGVYFRFSADVVISMAAEILSSLNQFLLEIFVTEPRIDKCHKYKTCSSINPKILSSCKNISGIFD